MILKIFSKNKKIVLASIIFLLSLFFYSNSALAQTTYNALVTIPGIPPGAKVQVYLSGLYTFLISVVGIVAMGAIVIGGARYLTSAGNPSAIEDAKHTINSAIIGLLLAISSWVIINTINPDILVLKNPAMPWSAVGYSPTASDPLEMCDGPGSLGNGTVNAPCHCIDNMEADVFVSPNAPAKITLTSPADGASAAVGASVTLAGKLTDASGNPVVNTNIRVYVINDGAGIDGMRYTQIQTNASGIFSILSTLPTFCADDVKLQAIFPETDPYSSSTFIASNVVNFTATGVPACIATDYPRHPAKIFVSGKLACKDICSNPSWASDGLYHCMKADLRVGTTFMPMGKQVSVKVGETVYFDGRTYSADYAYPNLKTDVLSDGPGFDNGVDRYEIDYTTPWLGWTSDYAKSETTNCDLLLGVLGVLGNALFDVTYTGGMTSTTYAAAGKYEGWLRITSKNGCYGPIMDRVQINVNP
ncbi:MAG: hypothetical protein Q8N37_01340 [bacterium]|nr:hypothetical protein [bacterium]